MIITIILENYKNFYQLVMKIFESTYYHPPILYIFHCKNWKYRQYLKLFISELNSKMLCFLFGKIILKNRSLSYINLKRAHHKIPTCRSTLLSLAFPCYFLLLFMFQRVCWSAGLGPYPSCSL